MRKTFIIILLFISIINSNGQTCTAKYSYYLNANNYASIIDSSINTCAFSPCCIFYNYGDTVSGLFNTSNPFGPGHFYKYPGTYSLCQSIQYQGGLCNCFDTTCKSVVITDTGSNCIASFCYYSYFDSMGHFTANLTSTSTSDDSITNLYWEYHDGYQEFNITNTSHIFGFSNRATLYIQTASGCQSYFSDSIYLTNNSCDSSNFSINNIARLEDFEFNFFPNLIQTQSNIVCSIVLEDFELKIYDVSQKCIQTIPFDNTNNYIFNRVSMPSGFYFYKLVKRNRVYKTGKILLE